MNFLKWWWNLCCLLNKFSIFYCCEWPSLSPPPLRYLAHNNSFHICVIALDCPKKIFSLSLTHIIVDNEQQIATNCLSELLNSRGASNNFSYFYVFKGFKLNFLLALFVHHQLANVVYSWKLRNKLSLHHRRFQWILKWRFFLKRRLSLNERMKSRKFSFYINHGCLLAFWSCKNIWKDPFN